MELSLVIPVWNDRAGLGRLLDQVRHLGIFHEVIVFDDASDEELSADTLPGAADLSDRITWLRGDRRRGAGHGRNAGLARARGSHVVFFDSDDLFGEDFPRIAAEARDLDFDFLIFRHNDSRMVAAGGSGSFPQEEEYWRAVGAAPAPGPLGPEGAALLCRLAAYPWNKIYRTDFLRRNRIGCTEIMVHNDIELHWSGFIAADRILCSSLIGAEHAVAEGGTRLTNRRGAERLEVFQAFDRVAARLRSAPGMGANRFFHPFMRFACDLLPWIGGNIDEEHLPELRARARRFLLTGIDRDLMTLLAYREPELARRINRIIAEGSFA